VRRTAKVRYRRVPWLDVLPQDYPGRDAILRKYVPLAGPGHAGTEWANYREATVLFLADRMADEGWDANRARHYLEMMLMFERQWCRDNNYAPPAARPF
jgi:hypothetical protein